jgi:hypothetical protein
MYMTLYTSLLAVLTCHLSQAQPLGQGYDFDYLPIRSTSDDPLLPTHDPFYKPDGKAWKRLPPGSVLKSRTISVPCAANLTGKSNVQHAYQLLYTTQDVFHTPLTAVTTILVPYRADPQKHVSYQSPYDSPFLNCAPSHGLQDGSPAHLAQWQFEIATAIDPLLQLGAYVSVPDYESSISSYTVGPQSAKGVLDSIRAVISSTKLTGIKPRSTNVMFGYSGGAIASEWAGEFHQSYAPELDIAGAAIGGLPTNVAKAIRAVDGTQSAGLVAACLLGIANTYPEVQKYIHRHVVRNMSDLNIPLYECQQDQTNPNYGYGPRLAYANISSFFDTGLGILTSLSHIFDYIGVMGQQSAPRFPLFIWKGTEDEIAIPIEDTDDLVAKYCAAGTRIHYQRYVGGRHTATGGYGLADAVAFISRIFAGVKPAACFTIDIPVSDL